MEIVKPETLDTLVTQYLSNFQRYYPGIVEWFPIVKKELQTERRRLLVVHDANELLGLAITKNGPSAKLCHISVAPLARKRRLGQTLMQYALNDMVLRGAREIRVTTSEEVYDRHAPFFSSAGFEAVDWQVNRYRRGSSEVLWRKNVIISEPQRGYDALTCAKGSIEADSRVWQQLTRRSTGPKSTPVLF